MKDWLTKDTMSGLAQRATNVLFIQSPIATSLGVMCGFTMQGGVSALRPLWEHSSVVNFSNVSWYSYVFAGILLCNVIGLVITLRRRDRLAPAIEEAFGLIRLTKKEGKLSEYQVRSMYINLAEKVLQSVTLDTELDTESTGRTTKKLFRNPRTLD